MDCGQKNDLITLSRRPGQICWESNRLIEPKDSTFTLNITPRFDLAGALKGGRLAMANVDAVPAGKIRQGGDGEVGVWDSEEKTLKPPM